MAWRATLSATRLAAPRPPRPPPSPHSPRRRCRWGRCSCHAPTTPHRPAPIGTAGQAKALSQGQPQPSPRLPKAPHRGGDNQVTFCTQVQLPHPTARWAYTQFLVPNLSHPPSGHCSPHGYWSHQGSPGCYGAEALSPDLTPALTPTLTPSPALTPTLTLTLTLARTLTLALALTLTLTPTITIALTLTLTRVAPAATVRHTQGSNATPGEG